VIHITCVNADREAHHGETEPLAYSGDLELRDIPSWCGLLNQTEVSSAMASGPIKVVPIACLTIAVSIAMGQVSFAQNLGPRTEATSCATAIRGNATFGTISLVCSVPPEVLDALVKSRTQDLDGLASAHKDTKLDRARMQTNLGNALAMLSEREADTAKFEEAVAAYREALKEQTRERAPLDWATTQNNLGYALLMLGMQESGTAKLEEAVAAYREALTERTHEGVPPDWAKTEAGLGDALYMLGMRKSGTADFENSGSLSRK
jgi:tetratricopeptide (TPR) repeat protein